MAEPRGLAQVGQGLSGNTGTQELRAKWEQRAKWEWQNHEGSHKSVKLLVTTEAFCRALCGLTPDRSPHAALGRPWHGGDGRFGNGRCGVQCSSSRAALAQVRGEAHFLQGPLAAAAQCVAWLCQIGNQTRQRDAAIVVGCD
jgi:hypothetical protein